MRGWVAFAAKRSRIVGAPFATGILPVVNRYQAWAHMTGIPWNQVVRFFSVREPLAGSRDFVIHAAAQWRRSNSPMWRSFESCCGCSAGGDCGRSGRSLGAGRCGARCGSTCKPRAR